jgi:hypothetical protein
MYTGWMIGILALALGEARGSSQAVEQVDLIELNHFHDVLGRHVYDQVIFYEWSEEHLEYHVRAWCLVEDREPANRRPVRSYTDDRYYVRWHDRDQNLNRCISSSHFRESWTQIDPERANKKLLDERRRTSLVKRRLEQAKPPLESPAPAENQAEVTLAQNEASEVIR